MARARKGSRRDSIFSTDSSSAIFKFDNGYEPPKAWPMRDSAARALGPIFKFDNGYEPPKAWPMRDSAARALGPTEAANMGRHHHSRTDTDGEARSGCGVFKLARMAW